MFGRMMRRLPALVLCWGLTAHLAGCSQNYEAGSHPPPKPPPKAELPKDHPPVDGAKKEADGEVAREPGAVTGTIRLAPELAGKVPVDAYLFLIARERADGGPPYAFKRIRVPRFPYRFVLGQKDVGQMFGEGIVFADIPEMYLVAKIDQDGRVGAQPGDMEGACSKNPVAAGTTDCDILIDQLH